MEQAATLSPHNPRHPNLAYTAPTSSPEGRSREALRWRDGVRRLRVCARSMSTRAASGLPPGPLGVPARSWLTTGGPFGCSRHRKRGPVCSAKDAADWRAERRPPWSQKDRGAIGLRFSARHPLTSMRGDTIQTPDAKASRQRGCMSSLSGAANSIPPHQGEGGALPSSAPACLRKAEAATTPARHRDRASLRRRQGGVRAINALPLHYLSAVAPTPTPRAASDLPARGRYGSAPMTRRE
jgi:hypothetical protein